MASWISHIVSTTGLALYGSRSLAIAVTDAVQMPNVADAQLCTAFVAVTICGVFPAVLAALRTVSEKLVQKGRNKIGKDP